MNGGLMANRSSLIGWLPQKLGSNDFVGSVNANLNYWKKSRIFDPPSVRSLPMNLAHGNPGYLGREPNKDYFG
jgi:hypothetical protein